MAPIPKTFIQELIQKINIVDFIGTRLSSLKQKGANYWTTCPFHQEKTPSFSISEPKQMYYCFGCQQGGNVIDFVMQHDHLTFLEAIETLANFAHMDIPRSANTTHKPASGIDSYQLLKEVSDGYRQQLRQHPEGKQAIAYLKSRGLTGEIVNQFAMGFAPPGWDHLAKQFQPFPKKINALVENGLLIKGQHTHYYDRFRNRIMFPIRDHRGRYVGFGGRVFEQEEPKYLNSPETDIFKKKQELFGLYEALQIEKRFKHLLIVEGYLDVISLAQFGIHYTVATLGTALSPEHLQKCFRYTDQLIVCFDGDQAGKKAAVRALDTSLPILKSNQQIRFLFLPKDEDPDSYVRRLGEDAFKKSLENTTPLIDFLFEQLLENNSTNSTDDRAALLSRALPTIKRLHDLAYRQVAIEQLSQHVRIDPHRIQQLLNTEERPPTFQTTPSKTVEKTLTRSERALSILLQYPTLLSIASSCETLHTSTDPDIQLLIEMLRQKPTETTAHLLEQYREHPAYSKLQRLTHYPLMLSETELKQELPALLNSLSKDLERKTINNLIIKAKRQTLTPQERNYLQALIKRHKIAE